MAQVGSVLCPAPGWKVLAGRGWDDLRLVGLKLIYLIVFRAVSVLDLSRRESWWKDAEILMLRHQCQPWKNQSAQIVQRAATSSSTPRRPRCTSWGPGEVAATYPGKPAW